MLDDFRLRIFLTLAEQNSFTKTAIALDVSQPAVSQSIAELEKKLGMNFFVNLPDKIGADQATAVESQNPDTYSSIWGIR